MVTWTVQPRAADLTRDADPATGWSELQLVERYNLADTWTLTGPWSALTWCVPGAGCLLDAGDVQRASGNLWQRYRWTDARGVLQCRASFVGDNIGGRIIYPDRTKALTEVPSTFSAAYDTRTSQTIEDLILGYLSANLGALAVVDRRLADLVLPASLGRGGTATVNARFDNLGILVQDLAEAGRLRVRVVHDESDGTPRLALRIDEVPDVSDDVIFGAPGDSNAVLTRYSDTITAPEVTRAIVAGSGNLAERPVLRVVDTAAEDRWGSAWVSEQLVDQRQTSDAVEMLRAGTTALEAGSSPTVVEFEVTDGPDVRLYHEWDTGYLVGVQGPDGRLDNPVREVITTVTAKGHTVRAVVGTPGASAQTTTTDRQVDGALRRIEVLERSA